jgi:lipoprotein-releasing system ATP-binding protein
MEQNSPTILQCQGLSKAFRQGDERLEVLRNVNFHVRIGECVAITGQSGSGKSTLLHLLGGLDKPTTGEVVVAGHTLTRMSDTARGKLRNRQLGFIYQFHHLLAEFTALENVAMPLIIRGQTAAEAILQAREMLTQVGLAQRLRHKPGELSGGERQRAAVARALISKPACVLADEPTGNLDRYNAQQVFELMLTMNRSLGTSLVVVTHDHELAARMDTVWSLQDGELLAQTQTLS